MPTPNEVRTQIFSSSEYKVYDPSSADVNLITDRPGYADASSAKMPCRAIYCDVAGNLSVRLNDYDEATGETATANGTVVTITVTAGTLLPIQAAAIESATSTVTSCLVMW